MTADLEARKLSIIEYLTELDNESIIQQIENLLKPSVDFWDVLKQGEKESIQRGISQLNEGERVSYEKYLSTGQKLFFVVWSLNLRQFSLKKHKFNWKSLDFRPLN